MPLSSSDWRGTSISSAIPKRIVAPRKQSPSVSTTPTIPTSPSPSYCSPGKQEATAERWACHTLEGVAPTLLIPDHRNGCWVSWLSGRGLGQDESRGRTPGVLACPRRATPLLGASGLCRPCCASRSPGLSGSVSLVHEHRRTTGTRCHACHTTPTCSGGTHRPALVVPGPAPS